MSKKTEAVFEIIHGIAELTKSVKSNDNTSRHSHIDYAKVNGTTKKKVNSAKTKETVKTEAKKVDSSTKKEEKKVEDYREVVEENESVKNEPVKNEVEIVIEFRDGHIKCYKTDEYTDYQYDGKYFIVMYNTQWIGFYNLDVLRSIETKTFK